MSVEGQIKRNKLKPKRPSSHMKMNFLKERITEKKILQRQMESPWWKSLKIDYSCSCEALGTIFGLYDNSRFLPGLSKDKIYLLSQQKFRKTSKCWNKREVKTS